MLMAFRGLPEEDNMDACHDDGNKLNNTLGNLKWGTRLENMRDKVRHGTVPTGENHFKAKITNEQVELIRSLPLDVRGRLTGTGKIARSLGISARHLLDIRKNKSRVHQKGKAALCA